MNKKNKIAAIVIIGVLTIAFVIALVIFLESNKDNFDLYNDEKIKISMGDELIGEFTLQELLDQCPSIEFQAIYKPSGKAAIERDYTGIYLRDLLDSLGVNVDGAKGVRFVALDGLQQIYTINYILEEDNVYLTYLVGGKPFNKGINQMAYSSPQEDGGPFVIIRARDDTSQHRVKLLTEIIIE